MDVDLLLRARELVWVWAAMPLLVLTALALTVRLRVVQWRRLNDGAVAAVRKVDSEPGRPLSPGLAMWLSMVGAYGAAGVVGAATAVSLGGPGVLPYVWVFGFLLVPLRYAEAWLARTDAPGRGDVAASGSLARRITRSGPRWRILGLSLGLLALVTGFAFAGGAQGSALLDATARVFPGQGTTIGAATAATAAALVLGRDRTAAMASWVGLVGILALLSAALVAIVSEPGSAFGALVSAFSAAVEGAPQSGDFSGAFVGEVAFAAILYALPAPAAFTGVAGGVSSMAAGPTRRVVAVTLLEPLLYAVTTTALVMAMVGSGAYGTRMADERRALPEVVVYRIPAETASQRTEESRYHDGYVRIPDGTARNQNLSFGTARGMIREPRFEYQGATANIAIHVQKGRAFRLLQASQVGALTEVHPSHLWDVVAVGEMLPTGASLVLATGDASSELVSRLLLAALLALTISALAAWGFGVARSLPGPVGGPVHLVLGVVPAAGLALFATGAVPWLPTLGLVLAGVLVAVSSLTLLARLRELATLDG